MKRKPAPPGYLNVNTEGLSKLMRTASMKDRRRMETMHRGMEQAFSAALAVEQNEPAGVMLGIFEVADEAVQELMRAKDAADVKCRRGCSACCRLHVTVTDAEAEIALEAAKDVGWQLDHERLLRQAEKRDDSEWQELPHDLRPCVFLTPAGECAIYEYRPLACRRYFVVSDPADCDTLAKPGHQVLNLVSAKAEITASAALEVFDSGTMAAMVLAQVQARDAGPVR